MEIRDVRSKQVFRIDDELADRKAREIGVYATGVYTILCRYANNETQTCYPSESRIANQLNISIRQVRRALRVLEEHQMIQIEIRNGRNNLYYLVDKKHWKTPDSQSPVTNSPPAPDSQSAAPRSDSPPKDTKKKDTKEGRTDVTILLTYFASRTEETKGFRPVQTKKDQQTAEHALRSLPFDRVKNLIDFFLDNPKSETHSSFSAAVSSDTQNLYRQAWAKHKWQFGDDAEPPTNQTWWR